MNVKTVVPLALALVLGLVAAMAAKNMIDKNKQHEPAVAQKLTQVVVARGTIPAGQELKPEDLTVGKMAGDLPPEAIFTSPGDVAGRVLKVGLTRGQPIMEPLLCPKGTGSGLQALVPPGMRAVTIEVNEITGVGGFLVPGCHIDLLATVMTENNEQITRTVVQNVLVEAINGRLSPPGPGEPSEGVHAVTLLATPKEAETINLAAGMGRPHLILRASGDDAKLPDVGVTVAELRGKNAQIDPFSDVKPASLNKSATTQPAQVGATVRSIKIIRGGVESETSVQVPPQPQSQPQTPSGLMTDTKLEENPE